MQKQELEVDGTPADHPHLEGIGDLQETLLELDESPGPGKKIGPRPNVPSGRSFLRLSSRTLPEPKRKLPSHFSPTKGVLGRGLLEQAVEIRQTLPAPSARTSTAERSEATNGFLLRVSYKIVRDHISTKAFPNHALPHGRRGMPHGAHGKAI